MEIFNGQTTITVFGHHSSSEYDNVAYATGRFIANNIGVVVTGGGGGIMMNANKGAHSTGISPRSAAFSIPSLTKVQKPIENIFHCFVDVQEGLAKRIEILQSADMFVFFPGGLGTMEALICLLSRMKIQLKLEENPCLPKVILFDPDYRFQMCLDNIYANFHGKHIQNTFAHLYFVTTQTDLFKILQSDNNTFKRYRKHGYIETDQDILSQIA